MSMTFDMIQCSRCDFSASSSASWGRFFYKLEDDRIIPMNRRLGWCHSCKTARAIENLDPAIVERSIDENTSKSSKQLNRVAKILSKIWPFRILEFRGTANGAEMFNFNNEKVQDGLALVDLIAGRLSEAKCLECGSTQVEKLDVPSISYTDPNVFLGFKHPECGGKLIAEESNIRINMIMSQKYFDREGNFLYENADDT